MRRCKRCGEPKPLEQYRVTTKPNGRSYARTTCRACDNVERAEGRPRRDCASDPLATLRSLFNVEREEWMEQAACRGLNTRRFFPAQGESITSLVRETCDVCPVRSECLDYAERTNTRSGIWGGLGERSRRHLRKVAS